MTGPAKRARHRRGVTTLEFGLVAPVALLLLLAPFEIGRMLGDQHALDYGVDAAARYAIVNSASANVARIQAVFNAAVAPLLGTCGTCTVTIGFAPSYEPGGTVTVTAHYPWTPIVGGIIGAQTLSSATTMTVQH